MKPRPTFCASVKFRLHSDTRIWAPSSRSHGTLTVQVLGPSGTLVKQQGSHKSIWGTKDPSVKVQAQQDCKVSIPSVNKTADHRSHHQQPGCCFSKPGLGMLFLYQVLQLWLQGQSSHTCLPNMLQWAYFVFCMVTFCYHTQANCSHVSPGFSFAFNLPT